VKPYIAGISLLSILLVSGCGANQYKLDGNDYTGADQFQSASDTLYRDTEEQLVKELRVRAPLSTKRLVVGIPSLDVIKSTYTLPNILLVTAAQISIRNNLSESNHKEFEMIARTIKGIGVYSDVTTVETTGARLQPSSTETVAYLYIGPDHKAAQWYT
jgi:hypothetical protein